MLLLGVFTPLMAAPPFTVRVRVLAIEGQPPAGQALTAAMSRPKTAPVKVTGGEWSSWIDIDQAGIDEAQAKYPNTTQKAVLVTELTLKGVKAPTVVEVEARFPGNEKYAHTMRAELFGPRLGLLAWGTAEDPHIATMAAYNRRYWTILGKDAVPPAERPKHFPIVDKFIGGDDDRLNWEEGITGVAQAGFNALAISPDGRLREMLLQQGIHRYSAGTYAPPGGTFDYRQADPAGERAEWAKKLAASYEQAGYDRKDLALYAMADEPGWFLPRTLEWLLASEAGMARFRAYLKAQGLAPADVGAVEWTAVQPIGAGSATDLPTRRLYYWTMRFLSWDASRHMSEATRALEEAFYPGLPVFVNWNNFAGRSYEPGPLGNNRASTSPDAASAGFDWLEFGRLRGCTMLWTEDWFNDAHARNWAFYCARLHSAARKGGVEFGGFVIPRTAGDLEDGILQKILCIAGSGGKAIRYFVFGPEYNFPVNCYSYKAEQVLPAMARAHRMIAKAEPVLWPGRRPPTPVAMLYPRSAQLWDTKGVADRTNVRVDTRTADYLGEVYGQFRALQRLNVPYDYIEEIDLTADGLKPYRLLYVTAPNVPEEGQRALVEWVRGGGTLVTVAGATTADRYNDPCNALNEAIGLRLAPWQRMNVPNIGELAISAEGAGTQGKLTARGSLGMVEAHQGKVLSTFADGTPAVILTPLGKGQVLHYALFPGMSYISQPEMLSWLSLPIEQAQIDPPVKVAPDVDMEAPLLTSGAGTAVTLLNWGRQPQDKLAVSVRVDFPVKAVESVTHGPLPFVVKDNRVSFMLPLKYADIVVIRPQQ
ncbi:MAG: beta-galactosidase trimerization domain-containing protein [Armatimonadota bacterium]